jgi:hypothetical protein
MGDPDNKKFLIEFINSSIIELTKIPLLWQSRKDPTTGGVGGDLQKILDSLVKLFLEEDRFFVFCAVLDI